MAHLKWTTKRPRQHGYYWFYAFFIPSGFLAHAPDIVEIDERDFNPVHAKVSQVSGAYFGLAGYSVVRYWAGPLVHPSTPKRKWRNG